MVKPVGLSCLWSEVTTINDVGFETLIESTYRLYSTLIPR